MYNILKIIHLFGVAIFLGNIIVTGVWKVCADRTNNPPVVAFAQRLVTLTDWVFTLGGVILILIGGFGMMMVAGYNFSALWLAVGFGVFLTSGVIWIAVLLPLQIRQAELARGFEKGGPIPPVYWRLSRQWLIWGTVATVIPLLNLYVMVVKP